MQPPPPQLTFPQNSKKSRKRVMTEMEPDVIEIPPPPSVMKMMTSRSDNRRSNNNNNNKLKRQQVILHEVIDVDNDEDDIMILDEKVDTKNKGKSIEDNSGGCMLAKEAAANYQFSPSKASASQAHKPIISNSDMLYDNGYIDITSDDIMNFDQYAYLQAHFDNVDVPPGVEAPISCLMDSVHMTKKTVNGSDSLDVATRHQKDSNAVVSRSLKSAALGKKLSSASSSGVQIPVHSTSPASGANSFSSWVIPQTARSKKSTASQHGGSTMNPTTIHSKPIPIPPHNSTNYKSVNQLHKATGPFGGELLNWGQYTPFPINNQGGSTNPFSPSFPADVSGLNYPVAGPSVSWYTSTLNYSSTNHTSHSVFYDGLYSAKNHTEESVARTPIHVNEDIMSKYQNFKRFDTVEDHSDHHYAYYKSSSIKQPAKNWAKKIQEEWRILENDLPDTIFVRVYESRMDLLRAVIIGAEGTPYHDGLFFFDFFFPSGYPNAPPNVYYHSGGLRLNPNLYNCGKVCLSLLGTWHGDKNESWLPGVSTVLQVLVSIQALILNQKPYFNEPGFASMSGSAQGEKRSQQYNENTFILSLKTMMYTMRRPPKYFEDFVLGHFYNHAHDILVACKAYMDGAQVGCLVKGGVQDVDEGDKSCSKSFKDSLPGCVDQLLKEFSLIGAKDIGTFQNLVKGNK